MSGMGERLQIYVRSSAATPVDPVWQSMVWDSHSGERMYESEWYRDKAAVMRLAKRRKSKMDSGIKPPDNEGWRKP